MPEWKDRMKPKVACSETLLAIALQKAGLNKNMVTQQPIWLVDEDHEAFQTVPDFTFHCKTGDKTVYLDGPHHLKCRVAERDEKIDKLLNAKGIQVKRVPYDGHKLKPSEVTVIVNEITTWLAE